MQPRQRGINLGFLLLLSQIFQVGVNNIPVVTLGTLALNILLFLKPMKNLLSVCISVHEAYYQSDWKRLIFSPFHHADDWHLYFNMMSLLWKGKKLEPRLGSAWFAYIIAVFSVLTGVVYILLELVLAELMDDHVYRMQCAVGFSGVLFALKVLNNHYHPGGATVVMGFPVPNKYSCWVELIVIHFISPGSSFVGHLAGILVGLMYTKGPLKAIMKGIAGFFPSDGRYAERMYYNSSGYSGHRQERDHSYYSPASTPYEAYTGGLSEEEQYQEAIQASLNDRGRSGSWRPPPYGFRVPTEQPTPEDIRRQRLHRFDR
ncbi:rhomboid-related protein 4 [Protopterus annectens]|uniref:rhomboid-related protein 4 n=1 Tax=Protopterus annectens TaxID=7888 RepID=UPI001CFA6030|nr:rhomboid-related protein 4 [Protopterus annectens]XP_043926174.1 rhomboid-related protein 4 [Protopterus annectens]XP_043926175.1 rhomboid-related protein 4 [Protopterus annectens]